MQKLFGSGTYNGFTGMLVTAVRNEIVKHLVGYYNDFIKRYPQAAASQLSISNFMILILIHYYLQHITI